MLCFKNSSFQVAGEDINDEECHSRGGTNVHLDDYWMTPAWPIEPWLTHFAVFNNHHPCLTAEQAETNCQAHRAYEWVNGRAEDESSERNHQCRLVW